MRDHIVLGPAKVPPGIAVSSQANPATDQNLSFLKSYTIRSDGKLLAIHQGGILVPWQQRHKPDAGVGL